jgi:hypothetical protein
MATEREAEEVNDKYGMRLLDLPGVVLVGVEQDAPGEFVLAVHIESDDPEIRKDLPKEIEGCPVKVVYTGPYRKLPAR